MNCVYNKFSIAVKTVHPEANDLMSLPASRSGSSTDVLCCDVRLENSITRSMTIASDLLDKIYKFQHQSSLMLRETNSD